MENTIEIVKATIVMIPGRPDVVYLTLNQPSPIETDKDQITLEFKATEGKGLEYLHKYFKVKRVNLVPISRAARHDPSEF